MSVYNDAAAAVTYGEPPPLSSTRVRSGARRARGRLGQSIPQPTHVAAAGRLAVPCLPFAPRDAALQFGDCVNKWEVVHLFFGGRVFLRGFLFASSSSECLSTEIVSNSIGTDKPFVRLSADKRTDSFNWCILALKCDVLWQKF